MACACIGVYRKERLDESYREILRQYQKYVIEDTCWFSIELEWHMKPTYTDYERQQLTEVFGSFPEQEIFIFGEDDRIFVVAYEIIVHFGGLLSVNLSGSREEINLSSGRKIEIHKIRHRNPLKFEPAYWLVDQYFILDTFAKGNEHNFERFKLNRFLLYA
jgi:hypothetical protein